MAGEKIDMPLPLRLSLRRPGQKQQGIAGALKQGGGDIILVQLGRHDRFVFTYEGKRTMTANTKAWRNALNRAGIEDFRWHDLRHAWACRHVQNGTPLHALQELGGWESVVMVWQYGHLSSDHLRKFAENI